MKITAVIPTQNEEKNIRKVIENIKRVSEIKEIVVVDDCSVDNTKNILKKTAGIKTIFLTKHQGKTFALRKGVEESKYDNILLVDANLFGLNEYYIQAVIESFKDGFDMVILDYGGQGYKWARKLIKLFPALSGVRLLKKADFNQINFTQNKNSNIENLLNSWFIEQKKKIAVVAGEIVKKPSTWEKYPLFSEVYLDSSVYRNMLRSYSLKEIPKLLRQWREIDKHTYTKKPRKHKALAVSAVIPAYNEEKNIIRVLDCLKSVSEICEIIVVDDGSIDETSEYAESVGGIKIIKNTKNLGKTRSVLKGIEACKNDAILMVDADLVGLENNHIQELIDTYKLGFDMVILDYGNQEFYLRKIVRSFPALSGVRIVSKKEIKKIKFKKTDRFELENRINNYYLNNNLILIVINGEMVHTPHKFEKYSFHKGLYLEAKALKEIFLSEGASNIGKLVKTWWEINAKRK